MCSSLTCGWSRRSASSSAQDRTFFAYSLNGISIGVML